MSAAHAQKIQHGALRLQNRSTTDCADFDRRHTDGDLEVAVQTVRLLANQDIHACRVVF